MNMGSAANSGLCSVFIGMLNPYLTLLWRSLCNTCSTAKQNKKQSEASVS